MEAFRGPHPGVSVSVQQSGSAEGFKRLCAGEVDIAAPSRPINAAESAACAKNGGSRGDYTKNEDHIVVAEGIAGDPDAIGYLGQAYYRARRDRLKLVAVNSGKGCVLPGLDTILDNSYRPLSRPLFVYVSKASASRPEVRALAEFFVAPENAKLVQDVGYVALPTATSLAVARRLATGVTGSIFGGKGSVLGVTADVFKEDDRVKSALVQ